MTHRIDMFGPSFSTKQGKDTSAGTHIKNYFILKQELVLINNILIRLCSDYILQHFLQEQSKHS